MNQNNAVVAIDAITWVATHKPLLDLSVMLTEYLGNQMISKDSKTWLTYFVGWNTTVHVQDIIREAYQYEKSLLFKSETPNMHSVIGVLSQVNALVSGATSGNLPLGANIAQILGSLHGNATNLAQLPPAMSNATKEIVTSVITEARTKHMNQATVPQDIMIKIPPSDREWVHLGFNDLVNDTPTLDHIQATYDKWRKWGKSHEHTVWNALLAGSSAESKHWGGIAATAENEVMSYLHSALSALHATYAENPAAMIKQAEKVKSEVRAATEAVKPTVVDIIKKAEAEAKILEAAANAAVKAAANAAVKAAALAEAKVEAATKAAAKAA